MGRVAADDAADGQASRLEAPLPHGVGDGCDVNVQAAGGKQRRADEGGKARSRDRAGEPGERADCRGDESAGRHVDGSGEDTVQPAPVGIEILAIERAVQKADQRAHPGDGVPDQSENEVRIADCHFEHECQNGNKKKLKRDHVSFSSGAATAQPWARGTFSVTPPVVSEVPTPSRYQLIRHFWPFASEKGGRLGIPENTYNEKLPLVAD